MNNDRRELERLAHLDRGVPERHLRAVFDTQPRQTQAMDEARDWLPTKKTFLVLAGTLGTGKSAAASWLTTKITGFYVHAADLSHAFGFDEDSRRLMNKYKTTFFLVIDDLGTEYADKNGFYDQGFGSLMAARYNNMLRTVITTNLTPDEFKARYPHFTDRLREDGTFVLVEGTSMRDQ